MKTSYLIPMLGISFLAFTSCNDSPSAQKVKDDVDHAAEKVESAVGNAVNDVKEKMDESFVAKSVKNNAKELEWLRAGSKMGTDPELVEIAKKMIPDHEKIANELMAYAAKHQIEVDSETDGVKIDSKTGLSWDEEWADRIRDMNREMTDKFEKVQSKAEDPALKDLVTDLLPLLRNHLNWTEKLEARLSHHQGQ